MNKKERMERVNDGLRKIDFSKRTHRNVVILNVNNTLAHELKKCEIAYKAKIQGFEVVTEAIFKDRSGIADVYLPEVDIVYEVLNSETKARFEKKNYPVNKIIPVRVDEKIDI